MGNNDIIRDKKEEMGECQEKRRTAAGLHIRIYTKHPQEWLNDSHKNDEQMNDK